MFGWDEAFECLFTSVISSQFCKEKIVSDLEQMLNRTWSESNISLFALNLQKRFRNGQTSIKFRLPFNLTIHRINNEKGWLYNKTCYLVKIIRFTFQIMLVVNIGLIVKALIVLSIFNIFESTLGWIIGWIICHDLSLNHLQYIWCDKPLNLCMIV